MTPTSPTGLGAAVLCSSVARLKAWERVLLECFEVVYLVGSPGRVQRATAARRDLPSDAALLPDSVVAVFLHTGDREFLSDELVLAKSGNRKIFVFNLDGFPSPQTDEIGIYRKTDPEDFQIAASDLNEVVQYALGRQSELPIVCRLRRALDTLLALSVLCQGFLSMQPGADSLAEIVVIPAEKMKGLRQTVSTPQWWSAVAALDVEEGAKREWGSGLATEWSAVKRLLDQIRTLGRIDAVTVAQAQIALTTRLESVR